jgi:hypothetical protein
LGGGGGGGEGNKNKNKKRRGAWGIIKGALEWSIWEFIPEQV